MVIKDAAFLPSAKSFTFYCCSLYYSNKGCNPAS
nr:MAG TPA: hypothetical protein [Caudoviricetes sp.]